jgi:hypothetical protein
MPKSSSRRSRRRRRSLASMAKSSFRGEERHQATHAIAGTMQGFPHHSDRNKSEKNYLVILRPSCMKIHGRIYFILVYVRFKPYNIRYLYPSYVRFKPYNIEYLHIYLQIKPYNNQAFRQSRRDYQPLIPHVTRSRRTRLLFALSLL